MTAMLHRGFRCAPAARAGSLVWLLLTGMLLTSGCRSTGYLAARRRDLADVVTATTGPGVGLKLRLGPLHLTPLLLSLDTAGLRGGEWFHLPDLAADVETPPLEVGTLWWASSVWDLPEQPRLRERGKAHIAAPLYLPPGAKLYDLFTDTPPFVSMPRLQWPAEGLSQSRYPAAYHTQLELNLAALWGVRFGVNPGETADFLLGWFTLDLYGDDHWGRPAEPLREMPWRPPWPFRWEWPWWQAGAQAGASAGAKASSGKATPGRRSGPVPGNAWQQRL